MKKYISIVLLAMVFPLTGCRDWLDINDNPNYAKDADVSDLLPTAQLLTADKVGYDISLVGYFWAQYVVQCNETSQYTTIMNYNLSVSSPFFTSPWGYIYSRTLPTLKEIVDKAEEKGGHSNYVLEAKTLAAYNLYLLTSLYDKVAYTEGPFSDNSVYEPKFDSGQDMQGHIIGLLESVRKLDHDAVADDEAGTKSGDYDMIFGGDTDAWFRFANTLYLRLLMRDFDANKTKIQNLLAEDAFLTVDAAFNHFSNQADKSNPLYESDRRMLNTDQNIRCCSDILNVLDASDPRLAYYYEGGAKGVEYGKRGKAKETSRLALDATDPVYFATVDEVLFLKAEAYARLNDAVNAKDSYDKAIAAAFARCGKDGAETFTGDGGQYVFTGGTEEKMVEQIINQKWAANVRCMPIESWFDINRTGYPERGTTITLYNGTLGAPACRFFYPNTSALYNSNSPEPENLDVPMWWHKQ